VTRATNTAAVVPMLAGSLVAASPLPEALPTQEVAPLPEAALPEAEPPMSPTAVADAVANRLQAAAELSRSAPRVDHRQRGPGIACQGL
jgi:hypothetical protein